MLNTQKKQNLGTLLIVGVLSLATSIIISFTYNTTKILPFNFNEKWVEISSLALNTYNQQWIRFVLFDFICSILIIILTIALFIFFIKQSKYFPKFLIGYFMIRILILAFIFYFQTIVKGPLTPTFAEISAAIFRSLIIPGAWIPYIMLSEKANETFIY